MHIHNSNQLHNRSDNSVVKMHLEEEQRKIYLKVWKVHKFFQNQISLQTLQ